MSKESNLLRNGSGVVVVIMRAPSTRLLVPVQPCQFWGRGNTSGSGDQLVGADDDSITSLYAVASDSESPSRTPFQSTIIASTFNHDEMMNLNLETAH